MSTCGMMLYNAVLTPQEELYHNIFALHEAGKHSLQTALNKVTGGGLHHRKFWMEPAEMHGKNI